MHAVGQAFRSPGQAQLAAAQEGGQAGAGQAVGVDQGQGREDLFRLGEDGCRGLGVAQKVPMGQLHHRGFLVALPVEGQHRHVGGLDVGDVLLALGQQLVAVLQHLLEGDGFLLRVQPEQGDLAGEAGHFRDHGREEAGRGVGPQQHVVDFFFFALGVGEHGDAAGADDAEKGHHAFVAVVTGHGHVLAGQSQLAQGGGNSERVGSQFVVSVSDGNVAPVADGDGRLVRVDVADGVQQGYKILTFLKRFVHDGSSSYFAHRCGLLMNHIIRTIAALTVLTYHTGPLFSSRKAILAILALPVRALVKAGNRCVGPANCVIIWQNVQ